VSPSSSSYFGVSGQDARSVFGEMGGKDIMHHLINTGSMANGAYTQEQGETVIEEEERLGKKAARTMSRLSPPRPRPRRRGRRRRHRRREEAVEVQNGDLWRMNVSPCDVAAARPARPCRRRPSRSSRPSHGGPPRAAPCPCGKEEKPRRRCAGFAQPRPPAVAREGRGGGGVVWRH
jgi:hypothetical protein